MIRTKYKLIIFLIIFFMTNVTANAQQTIISAPSSELLPAGDIILKDSNKYNPASGSSSFTPSFIMGIGKGMELSTGVSNFLNSDTIVRGDIALKKVWFLGAATRLTLGGMVNPYLNNSSNPDSFVFTHVTHRIKKSKTSITAGGYINGQNRLPDDTGVILGLEQVLIPNKLRLAIDWLSTPDSYGRMGVGLKFRPVSTVSVTSAVIIPNNDSDNIAFNISISKFISIDKEKLIKRRL